MTEDLPPRHAGEPGVEPVFDAEKLLSGEPGAPDASPGVRELTGVIAALRSPAHARELVGEKGVLDAFRAGSAARSLKEKAGLRPSSPLRQAGTPRRGAKVAVAAVIGSLALGGVAAAATTGSLPGPLQKVAHVLGAPEGGDDQGGTAADVTTSGTPTTEPTTRGATDPSGSTSGSPSADARGPNALGPSAFGLCQAFGNKTSGSSAGSTASANPAGRKPENPSVAYRNLVAAAADKGLSVDGFCRVVLANHGVPSIWPSAASTTSSTSSSGSSGSASGTPSVKATHGNGDGNSNGNGNGKGKVTSSASSSKAKGNGKGNGG